MASVFAGLVKEFHKPIEEIQKEIKEKEYEQEGNVYFTKITEDYRIQINKTNDLVEKLKLCLKLISELTGDEVFYKQNMKPITEAQDMLKKHLLNQSTVVIVDLSRRYIAHKQYFNADRTVLNQYLYEASKNDFELVVNRLEHLQNPTLELANKIIELEKERLRIEEAYRTVILND